MVRPKQLCPVRRIVRALTRRRAAPASVEVIDPASVVSQTWQQRELLTGSDLTDFIALRRVCGRLDDHVTQVGDVFYDAERPLLPHVGDSVAMLVEVGLATVGDPDPNDSRRRVTVTDDGRARYEDLCRRQGYTPYAEPNPGGTGSFGWLSS